MDKLAIEEMNVLTQLKVVVVEVVETVVVVVVEEEEEEEVLVEEALGEINRHNHQEEVVGEII